MYKTINERINKLNKVKMKDRSKGREAYMLGCEGCQSGD